MRYLFALIMLLCSVTAFAASNDVLLNLRDPSTTSPLFPTLRVDGKADGATNPTVKLPTLPCRANAVAPTWAEGSIVPCSVDLAGALRTSSSSSSGTSSSFGAVFPAIGTAAGYSDGTNMQGARVFDGDSGGGTEFSLGTIARCLAAGGSTACFPPTLTSADTIANQIATTIHGFTFGFNGATWDRIRATSGAIHTDFRTLGGVAFSATNPLPIRLTDGTGFIDTESLGGFRYLKVSLIQDIQVSAGNSSTANLASLAVFTGTSQTTLGVGAVQVNFFADQNATITVEQSTEDPGVNWDIMDTWDYVASSRGSDAARTIQATGSSVRVLVQNTGGVPTTVLRLQTIVCPICDPSPRGLTSLGNEKVAVQEPLPAGTNNIGSVTANAGTDLNTSLLARNTTLTDGTQRAIENAATTATLTNVNDSATNVTLLASNANRLSATIYNDSDQILFVKFGATATTTSFTAKVFPDGYFEIPKRYTGIIDGIWAADSTGAARMTELTP